MLMQYIHVCLMLISPRGIYDIQLARLTARTKVRQFWQPLVAIMQGIDGIGLN